LPAAVADAVVEMGDVEVVPLAVATVELLGGVQV
jgi:hypothetical protein